MCEFAAASCDGGFRDNNVGSFLMGGVTGANVYIAYSMQYIIEQFIIRLRTDIRTKQTDGGKPSIGHGQQS